MKFDSCKNCIYLAEMVSHPCTDGKPMSNKIGYACVMFYMMPEPDGGRGPICPNWNRDSVGCEMHTIEAGKEQE